jgi:hypothetical protein
MIDTRAIRMRWEADGSKRDERGQRLFAASEARAAGWGGVAAVAKVTGVSRKRIIAGLKDLDAPPLDFGRVRRQGGGRQMWVSIAIGQSNWPVELDLVASRTGQSNLIWRSCSSTYGQKAMRSSRQ